MAKKCRKKTSTSTGYLKIYISLGRLDIFLQMNKIKILYIIGAVRHIGGGTERQLSYLISNLDRKRFEPHLAVLKYTSWIDTDHFPCKKISVDISSLFSISSWLNIWELRKYIRANGINIVQTFFQNADIVGALTTCYSACKVLISSRRDTGYWHNTKTVWMAKLIGRYCTCFLANSRAVAASIRSREGIQENRIAIIYNGIDLARFRTEESVSISAKRSLSISDDEMVVGLVANFRPVKDIANFIEACALVEKAVPKARFMIIGSGDRETVAKHLDLATRLQLNSKLTFLGLKEDPIPYISTFSVGVSSSLSEGFSNTLLEYGALGVPAVATDVGGNPEIVEHNHTGLLVHPRDPQALAAAVKSVLCDPGLRMRLGRNAAMRISDMFSLERSLKAHEEFYEKICHCGQKPHV